MNLSVQSILVIPGAIALRLTDAKRIARKAML